MQEKHIPMRKCTGCGEMIGKKGAVRVVRSKDGEISVDPTGKKAGRGAYICCDRKCLELARKGRKLERGLKCAIPDDIYEILEKELTSDK
ncbi:MAG: RNase P modulator RnpM [Oscillospiraceae bacterium]